MSARTPSSRSSSRASANGAAMKRVRHGTSAAKAAKRAAASGSRSMAMSSPSLPSRSATSRAWPPAPNVPSTATSPGRGSRRSTSSPARTGTCEAVISPSMAESGGDVGDVARERVVVLGPGPAIPELEAVAPAGHDDPLAEPRVLEQEARDPDPAGAVELGVDRVGREVAVELVGLAAERMEVLERLPRVRLETLGRPDGDAALGALRQDNAVGERSPELGRHGEPVLRIEAVVEGAAKGHCGARRSVGEEVDADRGGGVGGAPPPRSAVAKVPHNPPPSNTDCTFSPTIVQTRTFCVPPRPMATGFCGWEAVAARGPDECTTACTRVARMLDCRTAAVPSAAYAAPVGLRGRARPERPTAAAPGAAAVAQACPVPVRSGRPRFEKGALARVHR